MTTESGQTVLPAAKPARTFGLRTCQECGETFTATHHAQVFCTKAHKVKFTDRERIRGRMTATYLQAWRAGRRGSTVQANKDAAKHALSEMARLADAWNAEDKAAGRPGAIAVVRRQMATFSRG